MPRANRCWAFVSSPRRSCRAGRAARSWSTTRSADVRGPSYVRAASRFESRAEASGGLRRSLLRGGACVLEGAANPDADHLRPVPRGAAHVVEGVDAFGVA